MTCKRRGLTQRVARPRDRASSTALTHGAENVPGRRRAIRPRSSHVGLGPAARPRTRPPTWDSPRGVSCATRRGGAAGARAPATAISHVGLTAPVLGHERAPTWDSWRRFSDTSELPRGTHGAGSRTRASSHVGLTTPVLGHERAPTWDSWRRFSDTSELPRGTRHAGSRARRDAVAPPGLAHRTRASSHVGLTAPVLGHERAPTWDSPRRFSDTSELPRGTHRAGSRTRASSHVGLATRVSCATRRGGATGARAPDTSELPRGTHGAGSRTRASSHVGLTAPVLGHERAPTWDSWRRFPDTSELPRGTHGAGSRTRASSHVGLNRPGSRTRASSHVGLTAPAIGRTVSHLGIAPATCRPRRKR